MEELLGRTLEDVLPVLRQEGIEPEVSFTAAPGTENRKGTTRILRVLDGGKRLTAAVFPNPLADTPEK